MTNMTVPCKYQAQCNRGGQKKSKKSSYLHTIISCLRRGRDNIVAGLGHPRQCFYYKKKKKGGGEGGAKVEEEEHLAEVFQMDQRSAFQPPKKLMIFVKTWLPLQDVVLMTSFYIVCFMWGGKDHRYYRLCITRGWCRYCLVSHHFVFLPCSLEIHTAVFSALDDRPSTASCFHVAIDLLIINTF